MLNTLTQYLPSLGNKNAWIYDLEMKKNATIWDIYFLGITIAMGGQFFSWNGGLDEGFWCFLASTIMMGIGYICLTLCLAEMMSTLPFTGGLYGFVRVTLNPFWGYMTAVCEVLQNLFYLAASLFYLGEMIRTATEATKSALFAVWLVFLFITVTIYTLGGDVLMKATNIMAIYVLLALILFFILSTIKGEFVGNVEQNDDFEVDQVMERIHLAGWFYIGIEHLPLSGVYCARPREDVPRAMVYCMLTLFVSSICIIFAASANHPGSKGLINELMPFNHVYADRLGMAYHSAAWFTIFATFTTAFGFMFAISRQLHAMALSGMIVPIFKWKTSFSGAPYITLITAAILTLVICSPIGYKYHSFQEDIFNWCTISSFFTYLAAFVSFIELRRKYATVERYFVNPLGIPSALVGVAIFAMNFISVVVFQGRGQPIQHRIHPIAGFATCCFFALIWYCLYAHKYQCFSQEEQKIMFSAYVIKSNIKSKQNRIKPNRNKNRAASTTFFGSIMSNSTHTQASHHSVSRHSHGSSVRSSSDSASEQNVNSVHSSSYRRSGGGGGSGGSNTSNTISSRLISALFSNRRKISSSTVVVTTLSTTTCTNTAAGEQLDSEAGLSQLGSDNESGMSVSVGGCVLSVAGASVGGQISSDEERMVADRSNPRHKRARGGGGGNSKVIPEEREIDQEHDHDQDVEKQYENHHIQNVEQPPNETDARSTVTSGEEGDKYDDDKVVVRDSTIEGLRAIHRVLSNVATTASIKMKNGSSPSGSFLQSVIVARSKSKSDSDRASSNLPFIVPVSSIDEHHFNHPQHLHPSHPSDPILNSTSLDAEQSPQSLFLEGRGTSGYDIPVVSTIPSQTLSGVAGVNEEEPYQVSGLLHNTPSMEACVPLATHPLSHGNTRPGTSMSIASTGALDLENVNGHSNKSMVYSTHERSDSIVRSVGEFLSENPSGTASPLTQLRNGSDLDEEDDHHSLSDLRAAHDLESICDMSSVK